MKAVQVQPVRKHAGNPDRSTTAGYPPGHLVQSPLPRNLTTVKLRMKMIRTGCNPNLEGDILGTIPFQEFFRGIHRIDARLRSESTELKAGQGTPPDK